MAEATTARKAAAPKAASPAEHSSLAAALVAFQAEMPKVAKGSTARIAGKNGAQGYSYTYADLPDVMDAALPILVRHGLAFICTPERNDDNSYSLVGRLIHGPTGQECSGALPIAGRHAQEIGSSLTYNRRYLLACITGVVTDEDEDGSLAAAAHQQQAVTEPQPQPLTDAQQFVQDTFDALEDEHRNRVIQWAQGVGAPMISAMTPDDCQKFMAAIENLEPKPDGQPEADPWAVPADPSQAR